MRALADRIIHTVKSKRGETLMESIAAMLVFVILVVTITSMISAALRMTRMSTQEADVRQRAANEVLAGESEFVKANTKIERDDDKEVVFEFDDSSEITVDVNEYSHTDFSYLAFYP